MLRMFSKIFTPLPIFSAVIYTQGPRKLSPPVPRFGQVSPMKESRTPPVPPRMGTIWGFSPAYFADSWVFSIRW